MVLAEKKIGQEIIAAQQRGELAKPGDQDRARDNVPDGNVIPATFDEIGITRRQAFEFRQMDALSDEDIVEVMDEAKDRGSPVRKAGVSCYGVTFQGDETQLLQFSTAKNVNRRHLTESQRAMYAAKVANLQRGGDRSKGPIGPLDITIQAAADMLNIGTGSVKRGKRILRDGAPELVRAVEVGEVTVHAAPPPPCFARV